MNEFLLNFGNPQISRKKLTKIVSPVPTEWNWFWSIWKKQTIPFRACGVTCEELRGGAYAFVNQQHGYIIIVVLLWHMTYHEGYEQQYIFGLEALV